MNPDLDRLHPYPFERLHRLLAAIEPPAESTPIALSLGEPQHPAPSAVQAALARHIEDLGRYPTTRGSDDLRSAISDWLRQRFAADVDPATAILPVNGTREALFAFAQAVIDRRRSDAAVVMPNPCYQIYEGAAILAGAEPLYYTAADTAEPDFSAIPEQVWQRCQLLYICNPGNPTGAVVSRETQQYLLRLARIYDFVIAADECYSEIYTDDAEPPCGLLEAAAGDHQRCVVFHSLSKRSNLPGLRSGFVAGDPALIDRFARYRTYHGCAMPPPSQAASATAWRDEVHVRDNRRLYTEKFTATLDTLGNALPVTRPTAGFYLWPRVPDGDDEGFCRRLYATTGVRALPGRYLGRADAGTNPAAGRVRLALVADTATCIEAATRIRDFVATETRATVGPDESTRTRDAGADGQQPR